MGDKTIINYISKKKEQGLEILINTYGDYINTIVKNNLKDLTNYHEECINDIFLSIWDNIENYNSNKNTFKNWIGVISKYKTIDYKRKYIKNIKFQNLPEEISVVDKNLLEKEIQEEINSLLSNLGEKDKEIFIKYYLEDIDIDTIAKNMNTKPSNIYMRISRGKKKIRSLYWDK